jgi:hypothetical protein
MNPVEEIRLSNDLIVEIWDESREIAEDTTLVRLNIKTKIDIKEEYFDDPEHCEQVKKVFGSEPYFEYVKERTFVNKKDKDKVFKELLDDFKKDSLPYIARPHFSSRFARSKYNEIQKSFYKYRHILDK